KYTRRDVATPSPSGAPPDDDRTLEAVKIALESGADVNAANETGDIALHGAASGGYTDPIQFLADKGAKLNVKNDSGRTPLEAMAKVDVNGNKDHNEIRSAEILMRKLSGKNE